MQGGADDGDGSGGRRPRFSLRRKARLSARFSARASVSKGGNADPRKVVTPGGGGGGDAGQSPAAGSTLDREFADFIRDRGMEANREQLMALPESHKRMLLDQNRETKVQTLKSAQGGVDVEGSPSYFVRLLSDADSLETHHLSELRVALASESTVWVEAFLSEGGLELLMGITSSLVKDVRQASPSTLSKESVDKLALILSATKALMNNQAGLTYVMASVSSVMEPITECLLLKSWSVLAGACEILCPLCFVGERYFGEVNKALTKWSSATGASIHENVVLILETPEASDNAKLIALTWINTLVSFQESDDSRNDLRLELMGFGFARIARDLHTKLCTSLASDSNQVDKSDNVVQVQMVQQIELFDEELVEDASYAEATGVAVPAGLASLELTATLPFTGDGITSPRGGGVVSGLWANDWARTLEDYADPGRGTVATVVEQTLGNLAALPVNNVGLWRLANYVVEQLASQRDQLSVDPNSDVSTLKASLNVLTDSIDLQADNEILRSDNAALLSRLQTMQAELASAKAEPAVPDVGDALRKAQEEAAQLHDQVEALSAELAGANAQVQAQSQQVQDLQAQVEAHSTEAHPPKDLVEEVAALREQLASVQVELSARDEEAAAAAAAAAAAVPEAAEEPAAMPEGAAVVSDVATADETQVTPEPSVGPEEQPAEPKEPSTEEPSAEPEEPSAEPPAEPEEPSAEPEEQPAEPEEPSAEPEEQPAEPEEPSAEPEEQPAELEEPSAEPEEPSAEPPAEPEEPSAEPEAESEPEGPATEPEEPSTEPKELATEPEAPSAATKSDDGPADDAAATPNEATDAIPMNPARASAVDIVRQKVGSETWDQGDLLDVISTLDSDVKKAHADVAALTKQVTQLQQQQQAATEPVTAPSAPDQGPSEVVAGESTDEAATHEAPEPEAAAAAATTTATPPVDAAADTATPTTPDAAPPAAEATAATEPTVAASNEAAEATPAPPGEEASTPSSPPSGASTLPPPPPPPAGLAGAPPPPPPGIPGAPPPPPGVPGAPPPPGGAEGGARTSVPSKKPSVKVKQVNVKSLPSRVLRKSVFATMNVASLDDVLDFSDLETTFARPVAKAKTHTPVKQKAQEVHFLDPRLVQAMSVFLASVRKAPSELAKAVRDLNQDVLNAEVVTRLLSFSPAPSELAACKRYAEDAAKDQALLGKAERLVLELEEVPKWRTRLQAFKVAITWKERHGRIAHDVATLSKALSQMEHNDGMFPALLELVLAVSNFMNAGSRRVCAGFRLETLNTLSDTKSTDGRTTLLHYLVRTIRTKKPELEQLPQVMDCVERGSQLQLSSLTSDAATLMADANRCRKACKEVLQAGKGADDGDGTETADTVFQECVAKGVDALVTQAAELERNVQACQMAYMRVLALFGENEKLLSHQLLGHVARFLKDFTAVRKAVVKAELMAAEAERRRQAGEKRAAGRAAAAKGVKKGSGAGPMKRGPRKSPRDTPHTGPQLTGNVMDELMAGLRNGALLKSRGARRRATLRGGKLPGVPPPTKAQPKPAPEPASGEPQQPVPPNPASLPPNPASLPPNPASLPPNPASLPPNPASLPPNPASLPPNPAEPKKPLPPKPQQPKLPARSTLRGSKRPKAPPPPPPPAGDGE